MSRDSSAYCLLRGGNLSWRDATPGKPRPDKVTQARPPLPLHPDVARAAEIEARRLATLDSRIAAFRSSEVAFWAAVAKGGPLPVPLEAPAELEDEAPTMGMNLCRAFYSVVDSDRPTRVNYGCRPVVDRWIRLAPIGSDLARIGRLLRYGEVDGQHRPVAASKHRAAWNAKATALLERGAELIPRPA